jgi:hypothetical protein
MAKAKTDDPAFDPDEIGKLFKKAKMSGEPLPYAFGLASKPEDCGFLTHLRKPGKTLKKELKASSKAISKVCFGTFRVDENNILLSSPKPIKGIIKQLRVRFRKAGMGKFKPILVGPDGIEIDEDTLPAADQFDDTDDDIQSPIGADAPTAALAPAPPPKTEGSAELARRLTKIKDAMGTVPPDMSERLQKPFLKAISQIKKGEVSEARETIELLETVLSRLKPATPPKAPSETPQDAFKSLVADLGKLSDDQKKALMPRLQEIKGKLTGGEGAAALADIAALRSTLDSGGAAGDKAADTKSVLDIWNTAKENADKGITKLATALKKYNEPALDRIAEHGITGLNGGSSYTRLTAALMDHAKAGADKHASTAEALFTAIDAFRNAMMADPMVAHWENNPLGISVDIRGTLGSALDSIEARARAAI